MFVAPYASSQGSMPYAAGSQGMAQLFPPVPPPMQFVMSAESSHYTFAEEAWKINRKQQEEYDDPNDVDFLVDSPYDEDERDVDTKDHSRWSAQDSHVSATVPTTTALGSEVPSKSQLRRRRRQRAQAAADQLAKQPQPEEEPDAGFTEDNNKRLAGASEDDARIRELADELLEQLRIVTSDVGDAQALHNLQQQLLHFVYTDQATSRAAQIALQQAHGGAQVLLASCIHGSVREAMRSMFANYFVQEIVKELPSESVSWIPQELMGFGREVARHRFGCRILCRLLEHSSANDEYTAALLSEVLMDAPALLRHVYGTYVVRHTLEFGFPNHQREIVSALWIDLYGNAKHQYGSRVVEAALKFGAEEDRNALALELSSQADTLLTLAKSLSGRHVVKELLRMPGWCHHTAEQLRPFVEELRASKYGKVVAEIVETLTR